MSQVEYCTVSVESKQVWQGKSSPHEKHPYYCSLRSKRFRAYEDFFDFWLRENWGGKNRKETLAMQALLLLRTIKIEPTTSTPDLYSYMYSAGCENMVSTPPRKVILSVGQVWIHVQRKDKHLDNSSAYLFSGQVIKHACSFSSFQLSQRTSTVLS